MATPTVAAAGEDIHHNGSPPWVEVDFGEVIQVRSLVLQPMVVSSGEGEMRQSHTLVALLERYLYSTAVVDSNIIKSNAFFFVKNRAKVKSCIICGNNTDDLAWQTL